MWKTKTRMWQIDDAATPAALHQNKHGGQPEKKNQLQF